MPSTDAVIYQINNLSSDLLPWDLLGTAFPHLFCVGTPLIIHCVVGVAQWLGCRSVAGGLSLIYA